MPIGLLAGMAGRLAGGGLVRGTAGKILRGLGKKAAGPGTAIVKRPPNLPTLPRYPGGGEWGRGAGRAGGVLLGGRKSISRKAAELIAAGIAFEAGGKIFNSITGKEIKPTRRMNPGNTKALRRSVSRIKSAAKMYGKVLSASKGTRASGYTIKPKGKCK